MTIEELKKELTFKHEMLKMKHSELRESFEAAKEAGDLELQYFWYEECTKVFLEAGETYNAIVKTYEP